MGWPPPPLYFRNYFKLEIACLWELAATAYYQLNGWF